MVEKLAGLHISYYSYLPPFFLATELQLHRTSTLYEGISFDHVPDNLNMYGVCKKKVIS